jgi:hypothetical protein
LEYKDTTFVIKFKEGLFLWQIEVCLIPEEIGILKHFEI